MSEKSEALRYHSHPAPGKLATVPTKPCETVRDLSLAYSPGVAEPCLEIARDPATVYDYTSKGNLVAVITNGTAVLGLGDIGPAAAKPVMEGKGVLFKSFADIDVFDLELACSSPDQFIETVVALAPTFGGINLEDIKAPECFRIEEELKRRLDIPVFHDDQHGTAIIAGAALLNALEIAAKDLSAVRVVVSGAGAAAIASARLLFRMGLPEANLLMVDSSGVIHRGRERGMNPYKAAFARDTAARTLEEAMEGADVFFGLSAKDLVTPQMLRSMASDPIVFAMANPDPEIDYDLARATRSDVIMATGRSDFPNQVNNVLGFPYIFRGALDVHARGINEEMKMAAVRALAALAKESVHDRVHAAYGTRAFSFGREYLIPKPFDPRVLYYVAPAVAKAAIDSGMARDPIDLDEYAFRLKAKQNHGRVILRRYYDVAREHAAASGRGKRIAFPEGANEKVLTAAAMAHDEGLIEPVLLGKRSEIEAIASRLELNVDGFEVVEPAEDPRFTAYVDHFYATQSRKGVTAIEAEQEMRLENIFANTMLAVGDVDGLICGVERSFRATVKPVLEIVGLHPGVSHVAGVCLVAFGERLFFLADTAITIEMTSEKLASIAIMSAELAQSMNVVPRVALLSFSNFGSVRHPAATMIRTAKDIVEARMPGLQIDGEMQADTAVTPGILENHYPFTTLSGPANVLIFPDMQSANISFKLLQRLGGARTIGPILLGLKAPAYVLQQHAGVDEIFNMITVAAGQASLLKPVRLNGAHATVVPFAPERIAANEGLI